MSTSHIIGNGALVAHAFNKDCSEMAISINTQDVYILSVPQGPTQKFQILDVLKYHTELVTSIDWAPNSDSIVTCSADRNAYVWKRDPADKTKWKQTLVMLKLTRAVTSIKWSPNETKFAAGSSAKVLAIASYEKEYDLWNAKHIKKPIRSTVTCIDWHPNSTLVACGSTDFKCRIYYAERSDSGQVDSTWGKASSFGSMLFEASSGNGGWIHGVSFSKDGTKLAWVTHSSQVFLADSSAGGDTPAICSIKPQNLPFTCCLWVADSSFLVAGHDCAPFSIKYDSSSKNLSLGPMLLQKSDNKSGGSNEFKAMRKFQEIDRTATTDNIGTKLSTIHQNTIKEMRSFKSTGSKVNIVSTIGLDGILVFWNLDSLSQQMSDLSLS